MKSRIIGTMSAALLAIVFIATPVFAIEQTTGTTTEPTKTETSGSTTQTTSQQETELESRIAKSKDDLKDKPSLVDQKRIQSRCKNAQGITKSLEAKINGTETSRGEVYKNLVDRLTELQTKLTSKGADTTELKSEISTLQTKIATFKTDFAAYKQAVADLSAMNCVSDPTGFKAALETARTDLQKAHADEVAIKTYLNGTIKPTLDKIHTSLSDSKTGAN